MSDYALSHPLERAGLGKPPYRLLGVTQEKFQAHPDAPVQVGASCDFCGQGIIDTYWCISADGKRFKLGSDCIAKVYKKKDQRGDPLYQAVLKSKADKRHVREDKKIERAKQLFADPAIQDALRQMPHPHKWFASQGKTRYDWVEFALSGNFTTIKLQALHWLEKVAATLKTAGDVKELLK